MIFGKRGIALIFITLCLINFVSAIRISPPKTEGNFRPNWETQVVYEISNDLGRDIEVYARGDLADYITFDKTIISNTDKIIATLKLPEDFEIPGPKKTYVGAREVIDDEVGGTFGVAAGIEALILIHVPYPGKYIEAIGSYNPKTEPATIELKEDRALYWLSCGAQPTITVKNILSSRGLLLKRDLIKEGLSEEAISAKMDEWGKIQESSLEKKKANAEKKAKEKTEADKKKIEEENKEKKAETAEVKDTASEEVSEEEKSE